MSGEKTPRELVKIWEEHTRREFYVNYFPMSGYYQVMRKSVEFQAIGGGKNAYLPWKWAVREKVSENWTELSRMN